VLRSLSLFTKVSISNVPLRRERCMKSLTGKFDVTSGQVRKFNNRHLSCLVLFVDGIRADVIYSTGQKDSVFAGWLSNSTHIIADIERNDAKT
jgi:hypothetical protein